MFFSVSLRTVAFNPFNSSCSSHEENEIYKSKTLKMFKHFFFFKIWLQIWVRIQIRVRTTVPYPIQQLKRNGSIQSRIRIRDPLKVNGIENQSEASFHVWDHVRLAWLTVLRNAGRSTTRTSSSWTSIRWLCARSTPCLIPTTKRQHVHQTLLSSIPYRVFISSQLFRARIKPSFSEFEALWVRELSYLPLFF